MAPPGSETASAAANGPPGVLAAASTWSSRSWVIADQVAYAVPSSATATSEAAPLSSSCCGSANRADASVVALRTGHALLNAPGISAVDDHRTVAVPSGAVATCTPPR